MADVAGTAGIAAAALAGLQVGAVVRMLGVRFAEAGIAGGPQDARVLVAAALGVDAVRVLVEPEAILDAAAGARLADMAVRRLAREPVARILGWREFYGRRFAITPNTLDPRADSEVLIEAALELATAMSPGWPRAVLDIGTGSGCLLISLLAECPGAEGTGLDIGASALDVARGNARALGVDARARWVCADGPGALVGPFDLVVANPPYIATAAIAGLDPEVRRYDPAAALDGGGDGLVFYRAWLPQIRRLVPDGHVLLEIGFDQADAVAALARAAWPDARASDIRVLADLAGRARCVAIATRSEGRPQKGLGKSPQPG